MGEQYDKGFLAGWLDASLGIGYPSVIAEEYAAGWGLGYREGHAAYGLGRRRTDIGRTPDRRRRTPERRKENEMT